MLNFKETEKEGTIDTCTEKSSSTNYNLKKEGKKSIKIKKSFNLKLIVGRGFLSPFLKIPLYC